MDLTLDFPGCATLWIISAPSGGGKTSLSRDLVPVLASRGLKSSISVSYTTRAPRPNEVDGVHYHFVSAERFAEMVAGDEFLEHAEVFGRRYGTGRETTLALLESGIDVILDIDWQGGRQVRAASADTCSIFILPPSATELERRLRGRGQDGAEAIAGRMREAKSEMSHFGEYDFVVINRDFDVALEELAVIFRARRLRRAVQAARHRDLIRELLE